MFVRIKNLKTEKRTDQYYQLVETIKEKNIPRQRVIYTLGKVEDFNRKKVDELICALQDYTDEVKILKSFNELKHIWSKNDGEIFVLEEMWEEMDLDNYFYRIIFEDDTYDYSTINALKALIFYQVLNKGRHPILEWLEDSVFFPESLEIDSEKLSLAYQFLSQYKEKIEEGLPQLYENNFTTYDTRVLHGGFFPLEYPHKNLSFDKEKITFPVFMILSREGLPLGSDFLPYNNPYSYKYFLENKEILEERFSPNHLFFIDMEGQLTKKDYQEINKLGCDYITFIPRWLWRNLGQKAITSRGRFVRIHEDLHIKEFTVEEDRYIQCFIPSQLPMEKELRNSFLRDLESEITGLDSQKRKAYELKEDHLKGVFIRRTSDDVKVNRTALQEEGRFESTTMLHFSSKELDPEELTEVWSHLKDMKESFNPLYHFPQLEPGFSYAEERVRAHLALNLLSYMMERFFQKKLDFAGLRVESREGFRRLEWMKVSRIKIEDKEILIRVDSNPKAKEILSALKYRQPFRLEEFEEEEREDLFWDDEEENGEED